VVDVATLADRVMVLESGRVAEVRNVGEMLTRPRSSFAADLFGWNLLIGTAVSSTEVRLTAGPVVTGVARQPVVVGERAAVAFRPAAVTVHLSPPTGSARNVVAGVVDSVADLGALVRVQVGRISADVTSASVAELSLVAGVPVFLSVKATAVDVYPA
jgi:molybdate transport system ATP-binding protein